MNRSVAGHQSLPTQLEALLVGIAVVLVITATSVSRQLLPGAFNDDAAYLALGRALASGAGYHSTYLVGAPLQVKYPPGLPALLAVLWKLGEMPGRVQLLATAINIAACGAAAGLLWWFGRVRLGMPAVLVGVFAVLPFVLDTPVQYFTLVLSEPLFILATVAALVLYERLRVDNGTRSARSHTGIAIALGIVLAAAVFLRTQGVAVMAALLLAMLLDRVARRTLVTVAAVALTPVLAWHAHLLLESRHATLATQASETGYLAFLGGGGLGSIVLRELSVMRGNLTDYSSLAGSYLTGWHVVGIVAAVALWLLAVAGVALLARAHRVLSFVIVASVVVLLAWPVYQDRFLLPLLPLLGLAAGYALHVIVERVGVRVAGNGPRVLMTGLVAVAAVVVFTRQRAIRHEVEVARREGRAPAVSSPSYWLPGNAWFVETVARWTIQATKRDDRIAVVSPAGLWLYTGRRTVPMEIVEPRGMPSVFDVPGRYLASQLVAANVTVVLVESPGGSTARETTAIRAACPQALRLIQAFSGITAYRAFPGDACVAALDHRFRAASASRSEPVRRGVVSAQ